MRYIFVANQAKTHFFISVAQAIQKRGHEVGFITTNTGWRFYLKKLGFSVLHVANQSDHSHFTLENFVENNYQRDRFFRKKSVRKAKNFVSKIEGSLLKNKYFVENSVVVGELTWLSELTLWKLQNKFKYIYLMPHSIRFPSNRFAFFLTPNETHIFSKETKQITHLTKSEPFWSTMPARNLKEKIKLLKNPDIYDLWDPAGRKLPVLIKSKIVKLINNIKLKRALKSVCFDYPYNPQTPRLYICLHLEPERSVSAFLPIGVDQMHFTEKAINLFPKKSVTICLHPRMPEAYFSFKYLISKFPEQDVKFTIGLNREMIRDEDTVASISGSILGQLPKKTEILSGSRFFLNKNIDCKVLYDIDFYHWIKPIKNCVIPDSQNIIKYSHEGIIADPYFTPNSIHPDNIAIVSEALIGLTNK